MRTASRSRPAGIDDAVLALLREFAAEAPLTVELGLQTSCDATAVRINRGYPYAVFEDCFARLRKAGIRVCVHIIDGLPGEGETEMLATAAALARLRPDAVKIHLLHVLRGTALAALYARGDYTPMAFDAYVDIVIRQLELLGVDAVVHLIAQDGRAELDAFVADVDVGAGDDPADLLLTLAAEGAADGVSCQAGLLLSGIIVSCR